MPYEMKESPETILLSVSASGREELFREAVTGVLAATYGTPLPEGASEGRIVPVQAAGDDDSSLLEGLLEEALRAIREEEGTLRPPRWLAFDVNRVTVNLPLQTPKAVSRPTIPAAPFSFSSAVWGAWSVPMQVTVPSLMASISAVTSSALRIGGLTR